MSTSLELRTKEEVLAIIEENARLQEQLQSEQSENARLNLDIVFLNKNKAIMSSELEDATHKVHSLVSVNAELLGNIEVLKTDRNEFEEMASQAKVYSSLLEKMLECADDASTATRDAGGREEVNELIETTKRLEEENGELHKMMDEFGKMWQKDSRQFHETMDAVKAERKRAEEEIRMIKLKHLDDQHLLEETQRLLCEKEKVNQQLAQNQTWLNNQTVELQESLDKLVASREKTAEQLVEMTEKWSLKQKDMEEEIDRLKSELEEEKTLHAYAEEDFQEEMQQMTDDLEKEKKLHQDGKQQLEGELAEMKDQMEKNVEEYTEAEEKIQSLNDQLNQYLVENVHLKEVMEEEVEMRTCGLRNDVQELRERLESERKKFQLEMQKNTEEVNRLQRKISEAVGRFEEMQSSSQNSERLLAESKKVVRNLQEEACSLRHECMLIDEQKKANKNEADALRRQIEVLRNDFTSEKNQLQSKHDKEVVSVRAWFQKQTDDLTTKHLREVESLRDDIDRRIERQSAISHAFEEEITMLNVGWDSLSSKLKEERELRSGMTELAASLRKELDQLKISHEKEIREMTEAHKLLIGNLGVEELDEQQSEHSDQDGDHKPAEWELVDEE